MWARYPCWFSPARRIRPWWTPPSEEVSLTLAKACGAKNQPHLVFQGYMEKAPAIVREYLAASSGINKALLESLAKLSGEPDSEAADEFLKSIDVIAAMTGIDNDRICAVGDRLYTDIAVAQNAGSVSVLVLSGETDQAMVDAAERKPDYVLPNVHELHKILKRI